VNWPLGWLHEFDVWLVTAPKMVGPRAQRGDILILAFGRPAFQSRALLSTLRRPTRSVCFLDLYLRVGVGGEEREERRRPRGFEFLCLCPGEIQTGIRRVSRGFGIRRVPPPTTQEGQGRTTVARNRVDCKAAAGVTEKAKFSSGWAIIFGATFAAGGAAAGWVGTEPWPRNMFRSRPKEKPADSVRSFTIPYQRVVS